jgi:hypothetical protein
MNEMDENQLRGWRPRQVSAGVKRRIFRPTAAPVLMLWDFTRLAPATVCLLFGLMVLHFNVGSWRESRPVMTMNYSAGSNAVAFSDHAQERENHLATVTFDWTNKGAIQSSIGSHFGPVPSTNFSN